MFNKQLRRNIGQLDLQISKLNEELSGLARDTKYDVKIRTLMDLTELRGRLVKNQGSSETSDVVIELDRQIEELTKMVSFLQSDEVYLAKMKKLEDLTKIRQQLSEVRTKESNVPMIISGVIGISAIVIVLKYEEANVITSKAFNMAVSMFKRG